MKYQPLNANANIVRMGAISTITIPPFLHIPSESFEENNKKPIYQVQILPIHASWITIHSSENLHDARTALGMINLGWMSEVANARIRWISENGTERTECG